MISEILNALYAHQELSMEMREQQISPSANAALPGPLPMQVVPHVSYARKELGRMNLAVHHVQACVHPAFMGVRKVL